MTVTVDSATLDGMFALIEAMNVPDDRDDYDAKLTVYAEAGVPTYVIADPKTGLLHVFHAPRGGEYTDVSTYTFGTKIELPFPQLTLDTTHWPRD